MHATGDTEILRTWEAGCRMAVSMRVQSTFSDSGA